MCKDYENIPRKRLSAGLTPSTMEHLEVVREEFRSRGFSPVKSSVIVFQIEKEYEQIMRERTLLEEENQE